jgi:hypothetical protein
MLIIGANDAAEQATLQSTFQQRIAASCGAAQLVAVELGSAISNKHGNDIEHFG